MFVYILIYNLSFEGDNDRRSLWMARKLNNMSEFTRRIRGREQG